MEKPSISSQSKKCLESFNSAYNVLHNFVTEKSAPEGVDLNRSLFEIQDSRARYKAWGTNIAAFQSRNHPTSLDSRLEDAAEIRGRISKVLEDLELSLDDAFLIVSGEKPNETWNAGELSDSEDDGRIPAPDDIAQTSELDELFAAIKASNSSLMKLTMVIRNAPTHDDYLKAASRYYFDPTFDIGHVREKHCGANGVSNWLIERLGKGITRRRQFLKYREEHQSKMTKDWDVNPKHTEEDHETINEKPEMSITLTKATTYVENDPVPDQDGIDLDGSFGSQTSYEATAFGDVGSHKLTVPPHPKMAFEGVLFEFGEPFQCPYCYTEQRVKSRSEWNRNEWFAHELQNHRREWVCQYCQHSPFTSEMAFSTHLKSLHSITGSHLKALVLQSEEPVDRISATACPLCEDWETNVRDPKHDSNRAFLNDGKKVDAYGTLNQFRRHLGHHMEQLALFALPRSEEEEIENNGVKGSKDTNSEQSGDEGVQMADDDNLTSNYYPSTKKWKIVKATRDERGWNYGPQSMIEIPPPVPWDGSHNPDLWTQFTKDLIDIEAIEELGYYYKDTESSYYIDDYIQYEASQELLNLSNSIRGKRQDLDLEMINERGGGLMAQELKVDEQARIQNEGISMSLPKFPPRGEYFKCICNPWLSHADDLVKCLSCSTLQHYSCYYSTYPKPPSEGHFCIDCIHQDLGPVGRDLSPDVTSDYYNTDESEPHEIRGGPARGMARPLQDYHMLLEHPRKIQLGMEVSEEAKIGGQPSTVLGENNYSPSTSVDHFRKVLEEVKPSEQQSQDLASLEEVPEEKRSDVLPTPVKKQGTNDELESLYQQMLALGSHSLGGMHLDTPKALDERARRLERQRIYDAHERLERETSLLLEEALREEQLDETLSATSSQSTADQTPDEIADEPRAFSAGDESSESSKALENIAALWTKEFEKLMASDDRQRDPAPEQVMVPVGMNIAEAAKGYQAEQQPPVDLRSFPLKNSYDLDNQDNKPFASKDSAGLAGLPTQPEVIEEGALPKNENTDSVLKDAQTLQELQKKMTDLHNINISRDTNTPLLPDIDDGMDPEASKNDRSSNSSKALDPELRNLPSDYNTVMESGFEFGHYSIEDLLKELKSRDDDQISFRSESSIDNTTLLEERLHPLILPELAKVNEEQREQTAWDKNRGKSIMRDSDVLRDSNTKKNFR
ncbi:hypothetical protein B7494_g5027 [Chlorociboria aeruginascens]|nr:hypothetical protein B7494_g5027 [Chlorociboria aeruginascens]